MQRLFSVSFLVYIIMSFDRGGRKTPVKLKRKHILWYNLKKRRSIRNMCRQACTRRGSARPGYKEEIL